MSRSRGLYGNAKARYNGARSNDGRITDCGSAQSRSRFSLGLIAPAAPVKHAAGETSGEHFGRLGGEAETRADETVSPQCAGQRAARFFAVPEIGAETGPPLHDDV